MNSKSQPLITACLFLGFLLGPGCTKDANKNADPKQRLSQYVSKSFSITSVKDRQELARFLTGDTKIRLYAWSDDQFKSAFIDNKREFIRLEFVEIKEINPSEVHVTYELSYRDRTHGDPPVRITQKRLARMLQQDHTWLISEVRNLSELVEYNKEMTFP